MARPAQQQRNPSPSAARAVAAPPADDSSDSELEVIAKPVVSLTGVPGVANEVVHVFQDAVVALIKEAGNGGGDAPSGDDELEVIAIGQKRAAPAELNGANGAPAPKKQFKKPSSALPVLDLDLTFSPPNAEGALAAALSAATPSVQHPTKLADVVFQAARENSKVPHRLYLRHASTNAALVELDPLDPACFAAASYVSWIAPAPLTKSGKPFKRRSAAKRAPQPAARAVVPTGAGGLVDALALFSDLDAEGVRVSASLSIFPSPANAATNVQLHLHLTASLKPALFLPASYSRARRILLDFLLPASAPPARDAPREATIDYFFACLGRAPRTVRGLPLPRAEAPSPAQAESDEERVARERREAKGKGRAVSPAPSADAEGPEDEMLHPPGLAVSLMPFQARTVRWMLGREGKRVLPRETGGGKGKGRAEEEEACEEGEDAVMHEDDALDGDEPTAHEGDVLPFASGAPLPADSDSDGSRTPPSPPVLADLDAPALDALRRGPLWEEVVLRVLPREGHPDGEERALWLNRTSLTLTEEDPLELMGASGAMTPLKSEEEGEGGEGTRASKKVVGGQEGHGLLAEEVGLGKTVEALSLILIHGDKNRRKLPAYFNPVTDSEVQPSGLTLIIAPTAIVGQWASEIARLAPGLRVLRYEGVKGLKDAHTAQYLAKRFDVVLTTFDVLRKEVAFARKPAQRGLRNKREIRYRRSMLVELDFLRVLMDEAQMVGDAVGPTSETASLISRRFSWAVTSTPLRDRITDLRPLLTFLRVEPIASGRASLQRLLEETPSFKRLWSEIGERTLKSQVQHELFLPPQSRFMVPIEFTAVERFYYDQRYADALSALGLAPDGTPQVANAAQAWAADKPEMLRALTMLRQLCTHPQIGTGNRGALALGRVVRTVEEVYQAMREKAVADIQGAQRAMLAARVRRAQYACWDEDVEDRFEPALKLLESALDEVDPIIDEVTKEIHDVWKARKKDDGRASSNSPLDEGLAGALELGFRSTDGASADEVMSEKERTLSSRIGTLRNRLRDLLFVKHAAMFFSGNAAFSLGRGEEETEFYAQAEALRQTLLQPYENAVERAQVVLQEQLAARDSNGALDVREMETGFNKHGKGLRAIQTFEDAATTSDILNGYAELIYQYREMIIQMMLTRVSIAGDNATGEEYEERAALQEKLDVYLEAYTVLVGEWSYGITGVRSALADQLKAEAEHYLFEQEILPEPGAPPPGGVEEDAPIEDLDEAMIQEIMGAVGGPADRWVRGKKRKAQEDEEEDEEVDEDDEEFDAGDKKGKGKAKPKKQKKSPGKKTRHQAKRTANKKHNSYKDFLAPTIESGHSPAEVLRYELLVERLEAKGEDNEFAEVIPLRQLIKQLKEAAERSHTQHEIAILDRERNRIAQNLGTLEKVGDRLRAELSDLTKAFNVRLTYFANLQQISDEVADPDMGSKNWRGLLIEMEELRQEELDQKASIDSKQSRRRYLENLNSPDERDDEEETTCPICADTFEKGVLTNCGHLTCAKCFRAWSSVKRSCALCKQALPAGSYQTVSYRKKGSPDADAPARDQPEHYLDAHGVLHDFEEEPRKLSEIDDVSMQKILEIQTAAPLSSKSDFITKHVKYLRRRDPDAKIVIFSAWQEALDLIMEAFKRNGIGFVRLEGANGKGKKEGVVKRFQDDPDIAAFFLHTRSQSAGLNLTVARYVFLVEPLLHPSLELQAVARVHRITQTKQTMVFQYAVTDTVDRRVANLRARQNTSLFLADTDVDAAKESRLVQQKDRAQIDLKKVDDATEDEDDLARCILAPEAFLHLQRCLLPHRLQDQEQAAAAAAGPSGVGPVVHSANPDEEPAALAGLAAAERAALAQEQDDEMMQEEAPVATGSWAGPGAGFA
ncbi:hypothetical protein JCM10450v2_007415 [Rhodotorula kratochvilovae]